MRCYRALVSGRILLRENIYIYIYWQRPEERDCTTLNPSPINIRIVLPNPISTWIVVVCVWQGQKHEPTFSSI